MPIAQTMLDELWDFSDAVGSEARLRAAVADASGADVEELTTQVARALGLQGRYAEADALLDTVRCDVGVDIEVLRARVALERGRVRTSSGDAPAAVPLFRLAAEHAVRAGDAFLRVDALHMLAIADTVRATVWTDEALAVLDTVEDPRTLRWTVSLSNNHGWSLLDAGRITEALAEFERARAAALRWGTAQQVEWAEEALAECRAAAVPDVGQREGQSP